MNAETPCLGFVHFFTIRVRSFTECLGACYVDKLCLPGGFHPCSHARTFFARASGTREGMRISETKCQSPRHEHEQRETRLQALLQFLRHLATQAHTC